MDFFQIKEKTSKNGLTEIFPDFRVLRSKDIMVRGKSFYAIWDEERGLWSTDEYDVQRIVDNALWEHRERLQSKTDNALNLKLMGDFSTQSWAQFRRYIQHISDNAVDLDSKITFANQKVKKEDYVSKSLPYSLEDGSIDAYDEIVSTLYTQEERDKFEWAIGSIIAGEAKYIHKFIVFYGKPGTGKSTVMNIIEKLFEGYYTIFDAKALVSKTAGGHATSVFKSNPHVAIQHDGDLSKIADNSLLNSITSHEPIIINEKNKPMYSMSSNAFLFMGTNKPVKITDAQSGIIRRLIDVHPTGTQVPAKRYSALIQQVGFELGAIASHCLNRYREMGIHYYDSYMPIEMMMQTDVFFNYVQEYYHMFKEEDGITLKRAYELYKNYCDETNLDYKLPRYKFKNELRNYFEDFKDITRINGTQVRSYYQGFISKKITNPDPIKSNEEVYSLSFEHTDSLFDELYPDQPAQEAVQDGIIFRPQYKWENNRSILRDIDTTKLHYVQLPLNHIVIDFDIPDKKTGKKSYEKNLAAASKWPATYAELSRSGAGIHLHYFYGGDVELLEPVYDEHIEIKVFKGNSSLRRKLSKCNNIPIAHINSGLPLREAKKVLNEQNVKSEKALVKLIQRNLAKEIHPGTKPSMDFIKKILDDAYESDLVYDVTFMRPQILQFAAGSTNQAEYCVTLMNDMKFKSITESDNKDNPDAPLAFYDVEVFPNLLVIVWKYKNGNKVNMVNPSPEDVEELLRLGLIGFNNRRYDNHILYARMLGYTLEQLFELSKAIINNSKNALFREAYGISHADLYELLAKKQSLKKWEIELGLHHQEWHLPWDQPVPRELWDKVVEYCGFDVDATEAVFDANQADWVARLILAKMSGASVNDKTQTHAARIIFGKDREPQKKFEYTDLSELFPGYEYSYGKSTYRGEEVGEGGYVYSEPGMHDNVVLLDVESMHPHSAIIMNIFGPYTKNYEDILNARVAVKEGRVEDAKVMLNGILAEFLNDPQFTLKDLSYALKIVINIVYGMTSAKYDNIFKDPRNVDNIVAKRGALFMIDLKHALQERGNIVAHIKTDSVKIPNGTPEDIKFVIEFGKKYGYKFVHEATYEKMCLVNKSVYIAKYSWSEKESDIGKWTAIGAQFAHPYVHKTLFSNKPIEFDDLTEVKSVTSTMYLDFNEQLPDVSIFEKELKARLSDQKLNPEMSKYSNDDLEAEIAKGHNYDFIGRVSSFVPVRPGMGGGILVREKDGKYYSVTGAKGYRWMETEMVREMDDPGDLVDMSYHNRLVDEATKELSKYGDLNEFLK